MLLTSQRFAAFYPRLRTITLTSPPRAADGLVQPREEAEMNHLPATATRQGRRAQPLTPEQQLLADELHTRAQQLREGAAADGGLSIREAIDLAAVQMGLGR